MWRGGTMRRGTSPGWSCEDAFVTHLAWNFGSGNSALGLHSPVVYDMLLHGESGIHTRRVHVRNKPETSRSSRYRILHDDRVRDGTELLEVPLESLVSSLERETADEDFTETQHNRDAGGAAICQGTGADTRHGVQQQFTWFNIKTCGKVGDPDAHVGKLPTHAFFSDHPREDRHKAHEPAKSHHHSINKIEDKRKRTR